MLLISSGRRDYREYLMKGLAERVPLWLIDNGAPTWQSPYLAGHTVVPMADQARFVPDEEGLAKAATDVASQRPVLGVCTYDEGFVIATASVAHRLGLPGLGLTGAEGTRNKHRTRTALTEAGLPQPQFELARTLEEAAAVAERIGFPVVLKPRGMGASVGVVGVDNAGELADAFAIANRAAHGGPPDFEQGILVEEKVGGLEVSMDGAIVAGEYRPFFLRRGRFGPPPYFEEIGHIVNATDPMLDNADLLRVLADAHRALGVQYGMTHTEVKMNPRGPIIIEVNGRLAGDIVPYIVRLASGVDAGHVAADVARGISPSLDKSRHQVAGIRFLYPPEDCTVLDVSLPEPGSVPGLERAEQLAAPGTTLYLPPKAHLSRYGYLMATAPDEATCDARLYQAAALASVQYEPIKPSESGPKRLF
jgi:biotin carboxylase